MRFKDAVLLNKSNIVLDFHKKQHIIVLTPEKTKHTGRSLYILLPPQLEFLLTKKTDIKGYFFPTKVKQYKPGTIHVGKSLNHLFKKKLQAKPIEITGKSFHCFRHYVADKLRLAGYTNEEMGNVLGHSSAKQTRDYGDFHHPIDLSKVL